MKRNRHRKRCAKCGKIEGHSLDKSRADGLSSVCWLCKSGYHKARRAYVREYDKKRRFELKCETVKAYGGKCAECGESDIIVLSLDHLNNDGAEHRRKLKLTGGYHFYEYLKRREFPLKNKLRVLCMNCQFRALHTFKK